MYTVLALGGGALIGGAAALLFLSLGKTAGISGIWSGVLSRPWSENGWRVAFVAGLVAAGLLSRWLAPQQLGASPRQLPVLLTAGVLVGVGTRLANGCTSGHGICGLSRFSPRSLAATLTFMATGMAAAYAMRMAWSGV